MSTIERMTAALEKFAAAWPKRTAKAFYLGPDDYAEFMATDPPLVRCRWNNEFVEQPGFRGVPVRASKNVPPRASRLYDNTAGGRMI